MIFLVKNNFTKKRDLGQIVLWTLLWFVLWLDRFLLFIHRFKKNPESFLSHTKINLATTLGVVTKCTLTGTVKIIKVDGHSYCAVNHGNKELSEAVEFCKDLNARLPLPRNKAELDEFREISPSWTHVDARNLNKSPYKSEWVDAEDKPLGNRPVYQTGHNFLAFICFPD